MKPIRRIFPVAIEMPKDLRIFGLGIREPMGPGMVRRPQGPKHVVLAYFHSACIVGASDTPQPEGTLTIWLPGQEQRYGNPNGPWTHSWIVMDGPFVQRLVKSLKAAVNQSFAMEAGDGAMIDEHLAALFREIADHAPPDKVIVRNTLQNFLRAVHRAMGLRSRRMAIPQKFRALRHYIDEHFDRRVGLDELAHRTHTSRWHLCREYKRYFGVSPIEYMLRLRMQHAVNLLRDPDLNISDIARQCGYDDLFHFSKLFRKHNGLSPRQLRDNL